jgi:hypothetical protein
MAKFFDHIVLMICENTGWSSVQDLQFVKYINQHGTIFEHWTGVTHPSGPNYRAILSGQTWSGNEYDGIQRPNIATSIDYEIVDFKGIPAIRHNPFLDMNPNHPGVHLTDFAAATNAGLPDLLYLGMDDLNNAHSGSLNTADANVVEAINLFDQLKEENRLFVVLFDEGFGFDYLGNHIFCGMLGPKVSVNQVGSPCSHYNLAQFFCDNWGIIGLNEMDPQCKTYAGRNLIDLN